MKKTLKVRVVAVMCTVLSLTALAGCNTKIKVDYGYDPLQYVKLGEYKGITADVDTEGIEKNLIEKRMTSDQNDRITYTEVQRPVVSGDCVTITFYGKVGGTQVDELSNEDAQYTIGTDSFPVPGFLEEIIGMETNESKVVTLTIPQDFEKDPNYAGKRIVYDITLSKVEQKYVPMITDAYVKENFSCDTVAEYRQSIKDELQETIDEQVNKAKEEAILTQLQDKCECLGYPEDYLNEKTEEFNKSLSFYATMQNKSVDTYCQDTFNMTFDEYVKKAVYQELIIQCIAIKEDITITEYEYKDDLQEFSNKVGYSNKDTLVEKYGKDKIVKSMILQKAQDIVMDSAVIN